MVSTTPKEVRSGHVSDRNTYTRRPSPSNLRDVCRFARNTVVSNPCLFQIPAVEKSPNVRRGRDEKTADLSTKYRNATGGHTVSKEEPSHRPWRSKNAMTKRQGDPVWMLTWYVLLFQFLRKRRKRENIGCPVREGREGR